MIADDLRNFLTALLLVVGGLLPIVNPVGSAPMFLAMTHGSSDGHPRRCWPLKVAINSFVLIMGSLIIGAYVLKIFGLSMPGGAGGRRRRAVRAGLEPARQRSAARRRQPSPAASSELVIMRAFYPLTLPLTVDPGAISVAITLGANHAHGVERVDHRLHRGRDSAPPSSPSACGSPTATPSAIARWLGHTRVMVVLRLSAFIVLCIGVEITWNGVRSLARGTAVRASGRRRARGRRARPEAIRKPP